MSEAIKDVRSKSKATLDAAGFRFADSLPTPGAEKAALRPVTEIANRFAAMNVLCLYVAAPEAIFPAAPLHAVASRCGLAAHLTSEEAAMLAKPRDQANAEHGDAIGWRMENMVSLGWVLGHHAAPSIDGQMVEPDAVKELLGTLLPREPEAAAAWIASRRARALQEVVQMEDLFYCAHNAVRSAQFPSAPKGLLARFKAPPRFVPEGFDPVVNGGVIHERRHALTWCLSPGEPWDDTDLST